MSNAIEKFKINAGKLNCSTENFFGRRVKIVKFKWLKICGLIFVLLIVFSFAIPIIPIMRFGFQTHLWETQIKKHQNLVELQSWATNLIAMYGNSNIEEATIIVVTNKPPSGIPVSSVGPHIALVSGKWSGQNENYVTLAWGNGVVIPALTMEIGDTNFIYGNPEEKWKPGIYIGKTHH